MGVRATSVMGDRSPLASHRVKSVAYALIWPKMQVRDSIVMRQCVTVDLGRWVRPPRPCSFGVSVIVGLAVTE